MKTQKQQVEEVLKKNNISSKVKITKNEIHIKNESDMAKVIKLFPNMSVIYGFLN